MNVLELTNNIRTIKSENEIFDDGNVFVKLGNKKYRVSKVYADDSSLVIDIGKGSCGCCSGTGDKHSAEY